MRRDSCQVMPERVDGRKRELIMNHRKNGLPQEFRVNLLPGQQRNNPHPHRPSVLQPKMGLASQPNKQPVAPPVYRPDPKKVVQPKMAAVVQEVSKSPKAPPVYRPQPTPQVLQTKSATKQQPAVSQTSRVPAAPP